MGDHNNLKVKFMEQLNLAREEEKKFCNRHRNVRPVMQGKSYTDVIDLLDRCASIFDIEALARYIFDRNEIPTMEEVKEKSRVIRGAYKWKFID